MNDANFRAIIDALAPVFAKERAAAIAREEALATQFARQVERQAGVLVRASAAAELTGTFAADLAKLQARFDESAALAARHATGLAEFAAALSEVRASVGELRELADVARGDAAVAGDLAAERHAKASDTLSALASRLDAILPAVAASAERAVDAAKQAEAAAGAAATSVDAAKSEAAGVAALAATLRADVLTTAKDEAARAVLTLPRPRDGRDAVVREPLPFEAGRSYAFGSSVVHRGGTWYATRDTDAEPGSDGGGWNCTQNGLAGMGFLTGLDSREFGAWVEDSRGQRVTYRGWIGAVVYRGVHDAAAEYRVGDMVTLKGSAWVARVDNPRSKPGSGEASEEWTLAVKRGSDGRDGANAPSWEFKGWHVPGTTYAAGNVVRTIYGVWIAQRRTTSTPQDELGVADLDWTPLLWTKP